MTKILLTSSGKFILNHDLPFLSKPLKEMRLAYIDTATKVRQSVNRALERQKQMILENWNFEIMDVADKNENFLRNFLSDKDAVFVDGGNTFYLLKHIRESGFDRVLKEFITSGKLYIGVSAGSYIMSPTIEMATWKHADTDRFGLTDLTGLNMVPFLTVAHYEPEMADTLRPYIKECHYPVRILTDQQAIYVDDGAVTLLGEGEFVQI